MCTLVRLCERACCQVAGLCGWLEACIQEETDAEGGSCGRAATAVAIWRVPPFSALDLHL